MECKEKILDDIVRVDFYDADTTIITRSVPFGVPGVVQMNVTQKYDSSQVSADLSGMEGKPVLSVGITDSSDIQVTMRTPTHKAQPKREIMGDTYHHTLEIPVETGFEAAKNAAYTLSGKEILTILTAYDGTKLCVHFVPNSSRITCEDQRGSSRTCTLRYEAESLSGLVQIVATSAT